MINISALLDEIKASPYREIVIRTPHTGVVTFADIKEGDEVLGPQGQWKEKPGTRLATLERERNPKPICSPEKGIISRIHNQLEGMFVEAGTPLMVIRHMLTRSEVEHQILKKALHLFRAPERAKYYFTPEVDKKIRASDAHSVVVRDGMELFIMSRMKREVPLHYSGPTGVIYAVYFSYNENMDADAPLIGVCDELSDPHNLGAVIRTADAAGAHGVIIPKRRSAGLTAVVAKTSAGAVAHVPVARVPNLPSLLKELKEEGVWVFGTAAGGTTQLYQADLKGPAAIVIGSEGDGMGRLVAENCDFTVSIPMFGKINSLNASAAAAVLLYEAVRQRLGG